MQLQTALFFETPVEIFARVHGQILPESAAPQVRITFRRYANANSRIQLRDRVLEVVISDVLERAPAPILEALAWILISKLYRRAAPALYEHRYRLYLNRRDVRRELHLVRQIRGRKYLTGPEGEAYNLEEIFEELNQRFFHGLMGRPRLSWSRRAARGILGHFDPSHNAIVLSRILDRADVPRAAVEYVMYHEMLHLRFPVEHRGARRCVHTAEFKQAEREFPGWKEAKEALKHL